MTEGKKVESCQECLEQARLLGMSGSREAKHLAQIDALRSLAGRMAEAIRAYKNMPVNAEINPFLELLDEALDGYEKFTTPAPTYGAKNG